MMNKPNTPETIKAKILVVEDEGVIAIGIKRMLTKNGYSVAGLARSGEEVLNIVSEFRPDLILMDIILDGRLNGIQAAERIRKKYDIPVIFLTALKDDETFLEAYNSQPEAYIVKPFCEKNLLSTIEKALKKTSAQNF